MSDRIIGQTVHTESVKIEIIYYPNDVEYSLVVEPKSGAVGTFTILSKAELLLIREAIDSVLNRT